MKRKPATLGSTCEDLSLVKLEKVFPTGLEAIVGEEVLWRVSHPACQTQLLYRVGALTRAFTSEGEFSLKYSAPSESFIQTIQVGTQTVAAPAIRIVAPAPVSADALSCSVITVSERTSVLVDQTGRLISPPAAVILALSTSLTDTLSTARVTFGTPLELPSPTAGTRTFSATFSTAGQYPIEFEVTEPKSGRVASCRTFISVSANLVLAPACQIVVDRTEISLGQSVNASITLRSASGPAEAAILAGRPARLGTSIALTPTERGYFEIAGRAEGPGGVGLCLLNVSVGAPPRYSGLNDALFSADENSHVAGGRPCPQGYQRLSSVADCGQGSCFGSETICTQYQDYSATDPALVVQAIEVSENGRHQSVGTGLSCSSGLVPFGSVADCAQGNCRGSQLFCRKKVSFSTLRSGDFYLQDFVISPAEGSHSSNPSCPPGFESLGNVTDCGGGTCRGNQLVCVKRAVKP